MAVSRLGAALFIAAICCWSSAEAEDCKHESNNFCKCSTANLTLDIRDMGITYPASAKDSDNKYEFTYMPCTPKVCGTSTGEASSLCQKQLNNNNAFSLGRYTNFKWTVTNADPNNLAFELEYGGGDAAGGTPRSSVVMFKKGTGSAQFTYDHENNTNLKYYFDLAGSKVAPYSGGGGSSGGTIAGPIGLAIIFLALGVVVAYFVVGGIYMYKVNGARGMEVIPNYAFWKDFPILLKDGFFFVISPCYKRSEKYQGL